MIKLKILASLIFVSGLFWLLFAAYMFVNLESNLQLWENLQRAGMQGAQNVSLSQLRIGIIRSAIWFLIFGLLSLISGIGLFLLKNWARLLWLGVLILLVGTSLYSLFSYYQRGVLDAGNVIEFFIIGVIVVGMWLYFNRRQTKNLFQRSVVDSAV